MIRQPVTHVLLDVEGTTSSISFVYEKMFPYAVEHLPAYCREHWDDSDLQQAVALLAKDAGFATPVQWFDNHAANAPPEICANFAIELMRQDSKATGLKALQGLVWQAGFESGLLRSHLFDDVLPCLTQWHSQGIKLAIYSSGSTVAQRLFFGHTIHGDLNALFVANFDTTIGAKRETGSYASISAALHTPTASVLFLSDAELEIVAARNAGMQATAVIRPGNAPLSPSLLADAIHSFYDLDIA